MSAPLWPESDAVREVLRWWRGRLAESQRAGLMVSAHEARDRVDAYTDVFDRINHLRYGVESDPSTGHRVVDRWNEDRVVAAGWSPGDRGLRGAARECDGRNAENAHQLAKALDAEVSS